MAVHWRVCVLRVHVSVFFCVSVCFCAVSGWKKLSLKPGHRDKASLSAPGIQEDGEGNMRAVARQERGVWG